MSRTYTAVDIEWVDGPLWEDDLPSRSSLFALTIRVDRFEDPAWWSFWSAPVWLSQRYVRAYWVNARPVNTWGEELHGQLGSEISCAVKRHCALVALQHYGQEEEE